MMRKKLPRGDVAATGQIQHLARRLRRRDRQSNTMDQIIDKDRSKKAFALSRQYKLAFGNRLQR